MGFSWSSAGQYIFRLGISFLFLYFGYLAVTEPLIQANVWIRKENLDIISSLISVSIFMQIYGVIEILVALMLATGRYLRLGLFIAFILLAGTIINLGFNEIALRDFVIMTGVLYLLSQE